MNECMTTPGADRIAEMLKEGKNPVPDLAETVHSLLGMKELLTPSWVDSVRRIITTLHRNGDPKELKAEIDALNGRINELSLRRRHVLSEYLDLKGNIRVFCRIRPVTAGENLGRCRPVANLDSSRVYLEVAGSSSSRSYSFDRVFQPSSSQEDVFKEVEPITKSALDGYNACIFAYGQTGTGKTFTMEGNADNPGVVPRTIRELFRQASDSNYKYLFSFSMLEIYTGNLRDLLVVPHPVKPTADPTRPCLTILTDPNGGIDIENLVAIPVSDHNQALRLYRLGCRFRSTASTNSNMTSSRSHCLIRISITSSDAPERRRRTNKVWLIDLGGSERVLKTKASGRRLEEGKAINLSLSALGDVINALQRKKPHIPYRNSKLTQVLKDSLGEDSKTLMLVHVSQKEEDLCETICTLNFAARARSVRLGSEDPIEKERKEAAMENLREVMASVEDELRKLRRDREELNRKLRSLTRTDEYLTSGVTEMNPDNEKKGMKAVGTVPSSKLPGFMRPTVCSQRKSGTSRQIFDEKQLFQARRRRAPSHRAKSVQLLMKGVSEYKSDQKSVSIASCSVGLNVKSSADVETIHSADTSECDIKTVVFSEEKPAVNDFNSSTQHLKVDDWLQSHRSRPAAASNLDEEVAGDEVGSSSSMFEVEMDKAKIIPSNSLMDEDQMKDDESWFDALVSLEDENYHYNRLEEGSFVCDSSSTLESDYCKMSFEMNTEDGEGSVASSNTSKTQRRTNPLDFKHRRALFADEQSTKNANISTQDFRSDKKTRDAGGRHWLSEKVRIVCACALLGLGLRSTGFGDDFFVGLTL